MHENSKLLFAKYAAPEFVCGEIGQRVLEIGPDRHHSTFCRMMQERGFSGVWDTLDLHDYGQPTYVATNDYEFPIDDNKYDVVFSAQVIEHVKKIWLWMEELARVCKPGGLVITINPVSWEYHVAPVDCWRIYPDGMRALYDSAGIDTELSVFEAIDTAMPDVIDTISIGRKR